MKKRDCYILSSAANVMMTEPGASTWFLAELMTLESYHSEMPEEHPAGSYCSDASQVFLSKARH